MNSIVNIEIIDDCSLYNVFVIFIIIKMLLDIFYVMINRSVHTRTLRSASCGSVPFVRLAFSILRNRGEVPPL